MHIRWTEKEILIQFRLLGNKSISVDKMLSSSAELSNAGDMYDKILNDSSLIGIKLIIQMILQEKQRLYLIQNLNQVIRYQLVLLALVILRMVFYFQK